MSDAALALFNGAAKLLGCTSDCSVPNVFEDAPKLRPPKRRSGELAIVQRLAVSASQASQTLYYWSLPAVATGRWHNSCAKTLPVLKG